MAPVRGERSVPLPWGMPLGHGHEWGGSKLDQQRTPPPRGLMLHSVAPPGVSQLSTPSPPLPAAGGPPDTVHRPRSLRLGGEGGLGASSPPPQPLLSVFFKRFPTTIGSVRKLIVYKYPKLRKTGWGGGVALKEVAQCVDGVQAGGGHHPSLPLLSWQERVPPPRTPAHTERQALASLSPETAFLFFPRKKKNGKGETRKRKEYGCGRETVPGGQGRTCRVVLGPGFVVGASPLRGPLPCL